MKTSQNLLAYNMLRLNGKSGYGRPETRIRIALTMQQSPGGHFAAFRADAWWTARNEVNQ
jgi:hypothetical protein